MSKHDDQFLDELKGLKTMSSIDPKKKEEMRMTISKHAKKKRAQQKRKRQFVWMATAAAILLFGIVAATMINQQNMTVDEPGTPPENEQVQGQDPEEESEEEVNEEPENTPEEDLEEEEQPVEEEENRNLEVEVEGPYEETIMIEGMEESTTVLEYHITSHQISYQMNEFLGNDVIEDDKIVHTSDAENVKITVEIINNTDLNDFASGLDGDQTPLDPEENSFEGIMHHESGDIASGYYAYQINDDVLYIQFEYIIEAGDGVEPRLEKLRQSIKETQ